MENLSKCYRQIICKILNIGTEDSIFVNNNDAFLDRVELYRVYKDTDSISDTYKLEVKKFNSDEEYLKAIYEAEDKLYSYLNNLLLDNLRGNNSILKSPEQKVYELPNLYSSKCIKKKCLNKPMLRIGFNKPIFNVLRYIFKDSDSANELEYSFKDCIFTITGLKILGFLDDLDISKFDSSVQKYIEYKILELNQLIVNDLSPKYLNIKHLISCDIDGVIYETTDNKSVISVKEIRDTLNRYNESYMIDADIEIYKYMVFNESYDINIKYDILLSELKTYDIEHLDEYKKILYLRYIYDMDKSEYDDYVKLNGYDIKILSNN